MEHLDSLGVLPSDEATAELEAVHHILDGTNAMPHLAEWTRAIARRLRYRWPDTDFDIAAIPVYTKR